MSAATSKRLETIEARKSHACLTMNSKSARKILESIAHEAEPALNDDELHSLDLVIEWIEAQE